MDTDIRFERMTAEDIDRIYALELEIFSVDPWKVEWFYEGVNDPDGHYFKALCGEELVGYCGMYEITSKTPKYCKIAKLAVKKNFQHKGIGRSLLSEMLKTARILGLEIARLEISVKNPAIALYESFGFEIAEFKERYFEGSGDDAYIMCLYGLGIRNVSEIRYKIIEGVNMVKKNEWVLIHKIVLSPEERTGNIPEETKRVPLEMRVKGRLICEAEIGDTVTVITRAGRAEKGTLKEVNPCYTHGYGEFVPEILEVGDAVRNALFGDIKGEESNG